jgi:hypothetical protein
VDIAVKLSDLANTLALRVYRKRPEAYMRFLLKRQIKRLVRLAEEGKNPFLTADFQASHYQSYDDREQRDYADSKRGWETVVDGEIRWISAGDLRRRYVDILSSEIDAALAAGAAPSVLEVGCGNCINLVELKRRY